MKENTIDRKQKSGDRSQKRNEKGNMEGD